MAKKPKKPKIIQVEQASHPAMPDAPKTFDKGQEVDSKANQATQSSQKTVRPKPFSQKLNTEQKEPRAINTNAKEALNDVKPDINQPDIRVDNLHNIGSEGEQLKGQILDAPQDAKNKAKNSVEDKIQDLFRAPREFLDKLRNPERLVDDAPDASKASSFFSSKAFLITAACLGLVILMATAIFIGYRLGAKPTDNGASNPDTTETTTSTGIPTPIGASSSDGTPQPIFVPGAPSTNQAATNDFIWPVEVSGRVTSCFGKRTIRGAFSNHKGLDIGLPKGTPVLASKAGVVEYFQLSTSFVGYGTHIVLKHNDGSKSLYGHLQPELNLSMGQTVAQGEIIGLSGNTGYSTGPHLHFEIVDPQGSKHDPAQYLSTRVGQSLFKTGDDRCWGRAVLSQQN